MDALHSVCGKLRGRTVGEILQDGPRYVRKQLLLRLRGAYYRRKFHGSSSKIAKRRRAALDRLEEDSTVLFLCHGNICRSPFAERYAHQQIDAREINGITVESSGLLDQSGRQSPPNARTAASSRDVALNDNYSTQASTELIDRADLILLMDYRNYHDFTTRFPDAADRMFLLGIFDDHEEIPIVDPYSEALEAFSTSYDRIISSVDGFLDAFESRR